MLSSSGANIWLTGIMAYLLACWVVSWGVVVVGWLGSLIVVCTYNEKTYIDLMCYH